MPNVDYPYAFDHRGRTAQPDDADHVRDLIEQVLLTAPGERVMRPEFGSGLLQRLFEPNSDAVAAATRMLVQGALQQHLSHLIAVQRVDVESDEGALRVYVDYRLAGEEAGRRAMVAVPGART
ncbi:GPW/gp25 family protein [Dyella ginsengisoli]|uniref:GPW/gp25 family protein n=1 Tax=Dyella ginsengisoli TaxID=363848 RepID=UPI0003450001|nr:GPW/gp25 family protein [Dyella ginsengisoli]